MSSSHYSCHILIFHFLDRLPKNTQISNFDKIRPVEAEQFHVDEWTDMKKLILAFRNFVNTPKKAKVQFPLKGILNIKRLAYPLSSKIAMSTPSTDNTF
jgi:hypothetical protein